MELTLSEQQKEEKTESKGSLKGFMGQPKETSIHVIELPEGEGGEWEEWKSYLKKYWLKSSLTWKRDTQIQEAWRVLNKMKRSKLTHIIIKISKVKGKERILKSARKNQLVMYKEIPIVL